MPAKKNTVVKEKKSSKKSIQEKALPFDDLVDDEYVGKDIFMDDKIQEAIYKTTTSLLGHLGTYTEEPYTIIKSYFEGKHLERLVRHQIESYNHFINNQVQNTIDMFIIISSDYLFLTLFKIIIIIYLKISII
jgi:DNA-directed RNA polymerase beta subunit